MGLLRAELFKLARYAAFPVGVWLETQPGLWMSTDGTHLLLCTAGPTAGRHLGRGA